MDDEFFTHAVTGVPVHKATVTLVFDALIGATKAQAEGIDEMVYLSLLSDGRPSDVFLMLLDSAQEMQLAAVARDQINGLLES